jgi:dTDP-glucose 4,6-dehydratase
MQTFLVTGGVGFIGSNFILKARKEQWANIINLDKVTYACNSQTFGALQDDPGYYFVRGDIGDTEILGYLLERYQPDAIINFAAETNSDSASADLSVRSILNPLLFVQSKVLVTFKLLQASKAYWEKLSEQKRQAFRFLQVSTDEVYGSLSPSDYPAFRENTPYAVSKAESDHLVLAYYHTYGLPTLTTNASNNYGPRQFPKKLIPWIILNALNGKPLPIYGDGQNVRDWLYVEDYCDAIYLVLQQSRVGETYNIGGNNEQKNLTVIEKICEILDELAPKAGLRRSSLITFVKDRPGEDRRYAIDCKKINRDLGWEPKENFESGLLKTIQWYLDNLNWVEQVQSGADQSRIIAKLH